MNEHLAGVTLLAFGNSSADLFSNLASVEVNVPVFANSLSSALFVTMVCGGLRSHDRTLPKNRGIFKEFLLGLRPIKCKDWRKAELLSRVLLLLRAPIVVLCALYIPLVDYEMEKHGWNKLLNSINMMAFTVMNLTGSMFIIFICATEIDTLFEVISSLMAIDDDFMGATIKAFTGNLGTLFINAALAAHGYPRMAYASSIGGPLFTIIVTANTVNYVRNLVGSENMHRDQMEEYGNFAFVFLSMGLFSILLWSTTLGFFARRSVGLYSMGLYIIYIIFSMLVQRKVIHSFTPNKQLSAAFGDI
ncbi:hypothetical protein M5D96_007323 [Drosophila gunungcola]|uniref:Sodium/calcium exchanger membrane region domain-containing protein n=1 Tax=Drosophila gunungcola TaxID=103775 RepID=A0A9P9YNC5_9MUSC|nr:hypothetical protein M5D96_007323 [Drosophila gunungcola]